MNTDALADQNPAFINQVGRQLRNSADIRRAFMSLRVKIALMLIHVAEKLILVKKLQEPKSKTNQFNVQFEFYLRKFHNSIPKVGIGNTQITVKYETEAQVVKAINEYISNCVKVFNDGDNYESRSFKITKITYAE